ncbi:hypothetical protein BN903_12 [Halorubrum sp. AJ67]|nr:hypothetical protein BN903_12 [Halorubrum sp. AJ67]
MPPPRFELAETIDLAALGRCDSPAQIASGAFILLTVRSLRSLTSSQENAASPI